MTAGTIETVSTTIQGDMPTITLVTELPVTKQKLSPCDPTIDDCSPDYYPSSPPDDPFCYPMCYPRCIPTKVEEGDEDDKRY
jgi:hypothetical protein